MNEPTGPAILTQNVIHRFECVCVSLNDRDGRILSPTGAQDTAWTGVEIRQRGKIASRGSGAFWVWVRLRRAWGER